MELLELGIFLLIATIISSILDEALPAFSLPLLQIALGVVIVIVQPAMAKVTISPELFLVLFIAPLLFDETRHADKLALWRNKASIVSLAVGLVLASMLAVGFITKAIIPSVNLAAALALGAALGPTDAAAVAALSKDVKLTTRQKAQLSGESLINDASGVVSFQFASAAAVTGAFSALDAIGEFAVAFFGGLAVGVVLGAILRSVKYTLRSSGLENANSSVVLEVLAPFLFFLIGEGIGVSGILAVVAGGLMVNMGASKANPSVAKANIVSNSVWEVLCFVINGVIFVMLGMKLPYVLDIAETADEITTTRLIALVVAITILTTLLRFVWVLVTDLLAKPKSNLPSAQTGTIVLDTVSSSTPNIDPFTDPAERKRLEQLVANASTPHMGQAPREVRTMKEMCTQALVTTLAGPKGAVTMSVIMTLPYTLENGQAFAYRDVLLFMAAAVVVLTLLLANFLLPLLSPNKENAEDAENTRNVQVQILRRVITDLRNRKTPQNEKATQLVVRRYRDRIRALRASNASPESLHRLRLEVLGKQQEFVREAEAQGAVSRHAAMSFSKRLKRIKRSVITRRHFPSSLKSILPAKPTVAKSQLKDQVKLSFGSDSPSQTAADDVHYLILGTEKEALKTLERYSKADQGDQDLANAAAFLGIEHRNVLTAYEERYRQDTEMLFALETNPLDNINNAMYAERNAENLRVRELVAEGYRLELEKIQESRATGALSRRGARELREEVYLLQMDASDAME